MSILKTALLGNPVLREKAREVPVEEIKTPAIQNLIDDMIETMREYDGVGLAAPQVHESKQIAVIEVHKNRRYPGKPEVPLLILVNPIFLMKSDDAIEGWEGCLSIEALRGRVPRSSRVKVRFFDRRGREETLEAEGFPAVVVQHEMDHLAGQVFLDRMRDLSTLTHLKEYERFRMKPQDEND